MEKWWDKDEFKNRDAQFEVKPKPTFIDEYDCFDEYDDYGEYDEE